MYRWRWNVESVEAWRRRALARARQLAASYPGAGWWQAYVGRTIHLLEILDVTDRDAVVTARVRLDWTVAATKGANE